jgi:spermidine/putrescine transport system substrate-binding protein
MADLRPPAGVYTRRTFLKIAGFTAVATSSAAFLEACVGAASPAASSAGSATAAASAAPSASAVASSAASLAPVGGPFALFTWAGYDGKGVIDDWYTQNNIQLDLKSITNENMVNFMKAPGSEKWDASSVNQGDAEYLAAQQVSSPISVQEVPALTKMLPFFRDGTFWKTSDGVYNSAPWTWGPIGINTRPERVPADALDSYQGLLDPKWKGRIGTFDDALNMISTAACATGNDPGKLTRDQLPGAVKDFLVKLKPQLKVLSTSIGDQANLLISGDVDIELVGLLWFIVQAKSQNVTLDFRVPKEGAFGFCDAVYITPWAPHRANAVAYANALLSGDTAVKMQESVNQLSTNPEVNSKIKADVRNLYPQDLDAYTSQTLKWNKSWYDPNGQYATIDEWRKVWDDVKALG